jgi:hypothetical protein
LHKIIKKELVLSADHIIVLLGVCIIHTHMHTCMHTYMLTIHTYILVSAMALAYVRHRFSLRYCML